MQTDQKTIVEETGRWLRVGTLILTVLGPFMNTLVSQLRKRITTPREKVDRTYLVTDSQKRLTAVGDTLSRVIHDLKDRPYSQEMLKRAEGLTEDLQERINTLSQGMVECGEQATRELTERRSRISQGLVKRGRQITRELTRRSRQITRQLPKRKSTYWMITGFSIGLAATGMITYFFIRQRLKHSAEKEQLAVAHSAQLHVPTGQALNTSRPASQEKFYLPSQHMSFVAVAEPKAAVSDKSSPPEDASIIGVVSTRLYYPIETPIDQLTSSLQGEALEVVYFASSAEAEAEGFSAAG